MSKRIAVFCFLAVFIMMGLSQAGVSKKQPTVTPKAPPVKEFPDWYIEKFQDTIYFADFEDGQIPEGWEIGDQTDGSNLQITDLGCNDGNCYYWGFILPDTTFGYDNLWEDWCITPPISIPGGASEVVLTFDHKFNTESETDPIWDGHACWVRVDGTTWEQVHPQDNDAYYDSLTGQELHCWGNSPGWTGERDWMTSIIDLIAYVGHTIEINFLCVSDQLSSFDDGYEGTWFDNIIVMVDGGQAFRADADAGPDTMIFTGSNRGANWVVTAQNASIKTPPNDYDPGMYSLLGPEDNTCLSYYITTPWFTMPTEGYPRSSFYRWVNMPGEDPEDDNLLNDLVYVEITTDDIVWEIINNTYGSGDNDSTWELIDWNTWQGMKYHAHRGEDIKLRFKVHADETQEQGPGCDWGPPCKGIGFFLDDFLMYHLGVPQRDIGIAYIDVPYPLSEGQAVEVHIGIMNLGSTDIEYPPGAITFYEILDTDTNWVDSTLSVGDPLQGFPAPCLTEAGYPAVASLDTFDFVYEWTPIAPGRYWWRALYFAGDELPEDDSLTVPTMIRVEDACEGEISYIDRNEVSGSVPGFTPGNGPAVRFDLDDFGITEPVGLNWIRHDWTGVWSPYDLYIYGEGPDDSTFGDLIYGPITIDQPEPEFPETDAIIYLDQKDQDLQNVEGKIWVHLRARNNTNIQIPQRGDALEAGHDWLYFQGVLSRNTQAWDIFLGLCFCDPPPDTCAEGDRGDVDNNDDTNVLDVLAIINHILNIVPITDPNKLCRADCNGDNAINVLDAIGTVNALLDIRACGLGPCEPKLTPEVMEFLKSLQSYLSPEDYAKFMALVKSEVGMPLEYSLAQNYPNPFNPVTSIEYSVATDVQTSLKVYNILGQEVVTLVNEVKEPGAYTVNWDASDMASGIYFYRLEAGDYSATKRMVLMK